MSVGSGGTGKASGIVRCHYGVPALAAMAWWSLPLFENAAQAFGAVGRMLGPEAIGKAYDLWGSLIAFLLAGGVMGAGIGAVTGLGQARPKVRAEG